MKLKCSLTGKSSLLQDNAKRGNDVVIVLAFVSRLAFIVTLAFLQWPSREHLQLCPSSVRLSQGRLRHRLVAINTLAVAVTSPLRHCNAGQYKD